MAKQNYKQQVLDYLLLHREENIKRETLIADTKISKSRLSEILRSIKEDGYTVITPPRSGLVRLEPNNLPGQLILSSIRDSDLRQWLILFLLSKYGALTFRDLILKILSVKEYDAQYALLLDGKKVYDDNHLIKSIREEISCSNKPRPVPIANDYLSITTLRKDLRALRENGFVTLKEGEPVTYDITSSAPYILPVSGNSLAEFCRKYEEHLTTTSELSPIEQTYKKIQDLISWDSSTYGQHKFGKINQISPVQISKFDEFIRHPYKTNRLWINSNYNGNERHDLISVGLLFYSVETSAFYALCQNHTQNKIESTRLDFIDTIADTEEPNILFHSKDFYRMYEEMFAAGFDAKLYHVKILLQDYGNIKIRFQNLLSKRKKSSLRPIENPPEECTYKYIYEDDLRGLDDFARFLRSFGSSVLAVEPPELKEKMIYTYARTLAKYEKLDEIING